MNEDKMNAIKDLKEIRDTGMFNMFLERREVMQYANNNHYFHLVSFVGNDVHGKYGELLKADWDKVEVNN